MLFYSTKIENGFAWLDEEESRHLLAVLRRKLGDRLQITDGQGFMYETELSEIGKKYAVARILARTPVPLQSAGRLHIAIAPTKQIERFEWFLEKATEIGVDEITPLLCRRSERETVRHDRLEKILVSAMKQSLRGFLPKLSPLTPFPALVKKAAEPQKRIAWCADEPVPHLKTRLAPDSDALVLIGPEGDFAPEEIQLALENGFKAVGLGPARLRTETAGVLVAAIAGMRDGER